ncbi:MAG: hypothetical protein PHC61_05050 [Chitinivibrionales bacterium]|nr:hypothetical protein [Chitinivibrionales bacterium]
MKKKVSLQQVLLLVAVLSLPIFAASQVTIVDPTNPYAILTPPNPILGDSVVMQLILGNNSNTCLSPYIASYRIVQTSNFLCLRAPCSQNYLVKIGYYLSPIRTMIACPLVVGPFGPTYRFGVLNVGTYTVVDTMAGNDTLLKFTVSENSTMANATLPAIISAGAALAFDRSSNILRLSVPSAQSVQLELYGLNGRKIATLLKKEQRGPGMYQLSLSKSIIAGGCIIAQLKTASAVSVVPITILR